MQVYRGPVSKFTHIRSRSSIVAPPSHLHCLQLHKIHSDLCFAAFVQAAAQVGLTDSQSLKQSIVAADKQVLRHTLLHVCSACCKAGWMLGVVLIMIAIRCHMLPFD